MNINIQNLIFRSRSKIDTQKTSSVKNTTTQTTQKSFRKKIFSFLKSLFDKMRPNKQETGPTNIPAQNTTIETVSISDDKTLSTSWESTVNSICPQLKTHISSQDPLTELKQKLQQCDPSAPELNQIESLKSQHLNGIYQTNEIKKLMLTMDTKIHTHHTTVKIQVFLQDSSLISKSTKLKDIQKKYIDTLNNHQLSLTEKQNSLITCLKDFQTTFPKESKLITQQSINKLKNNLKQNVKTYIEQGEIDFQTNISEFQTKMLQRSNNLKEAKPGLLKVLKKSLPNTSDTDIERLHTSILNLYLEKEFGEAFSTIQGDAFTHWGGRSADILNAEIKNLLPNNSLREHVDSQINGLLKGLNKTIKSETKTIIIASFANNAYMANLRTLTQTAQGIEEAFNDPSVQSSKDPKVTQSIHKMAQNLNILSEGYISGFKQETTLTQASTKEIISELVANQTTDLTTTEKETFIELLSAQAVSRFAHKNIIESSRHQLYDAIPTKIKSFNVMSKSATTTQKWPNLFNKKNVLGFTTHEAPFNKPFSKMASYIEKELKKTTNLSPTTIQSIVMQAMAKHNITEDNVLATEITQYLSHRLEQKKAIITKQSNTFKSDKIEFTLDSKKSEFKSSTIQQDPKMKDLYEKIKNPLLKRLKTKASIGIRSQGQLGEMKQLSKETKQHTIKKNKQNISFKLKKWRNEIRTATLSQHLTKVKEKSKEIVKEVVIDTATQELLDNTEHTNSLQSQYEKSIEEEFNIAEYTLNKIDNETQLITQANNIISQVLSGSASDITSTKEVETLSKKLTALTKNLDKALGPIMTLTGKTMESITSEIPIAGELMSSAKTIYFLLSINKQNSKLNALKTGLQQVNDLNRYLTTADINNPQHQADIQKRLDNFETLLETLDIKDAAIKNALFNSLNLISAPSTVKVGTIAKHINSCFGYKKLTTDEYKQISKNIMLIDSKYTHLATSQKKTAIDNMLTSLNTEKTVTGKDLYMFGSHIQECGTHLIDKNDIKKNILEKLNV